MVLTSVDAYIVRKLGDYSGCNSHRVILFFLLFYFFCFFFLEIMTLAK